MAETEDNKKEKTYEEELANRLGNFFEQLRKEKVIPVAFFAMGGNTTTTSLRPYNLNYLKGPVEEIAKNLSNEMGLNKKSHAQKLQKE